MARLACLFASGESATRTLDSILADLEAFRAGRALADDRTLLVARVLEGPDEKGRGI